MVIKKLDVVTQVCPFPLIEAKAALAEMVSGDELVNAGKAVLKKVQVLRTNDSIAVLNGGIEPGATVVVDGQLRLTDGAKVAVREGEKKP